MIPFVKKYLQVNWVKFGLGKEPADLIFIKFADRGIRAPEVGIISFLVKGKYGTAEKPLFILRFPRYPRNLDATDSLEGEWRALSLIHSKVEIQEVPRPVIWETLNSAKVLAISFLPGQPISSRILSPDLLKSYIENFGLAFSWLVNFQKAFGSTGQLFPQHGDFHAENIFVLDGKVSAVIDWEDFDRAGIPGFDLLHFIKTYFEALFQYFADRHDLAGLDEFSVGEDTVAVVNATADSYFKNLGIETPELPDLLFAYLGRSIQLARLPRKRAEAAAKRLEILASLKPTNLPELLRYMTVFPLGDIYKEALTVNDQFLINQCKEKINNIQAQASANG